VGGTGRQSGLNGSWGKEKVAHQGVRVEEKLNNLSWQVNWGPKTVDKTHSNNKKYWVPSNIHYRGKGIEGGGGRVKGAAQREGVISG